MNPTLKKDLRHHFASALSCEPQTPQPDFWQFRAAMHLARLGFWQIDLPSRRIHWSEETYSILGVDRSENPSMELYYGLLHPDEVVHCQDQLATSGQISLLDYTHRIIRPDGKQIYVRHLGQPLRNEQGEAIGHFGVVQDITDQKEVELQLKLNKQKFKSLVQNSSDIIAVIDEKLQFIYVSPTSFRIAGYQPEELIGRTALELIHEEDLPAVLAELAEVVANANSGVPTPHRFRRKDGTWMWLESTGINLVDEAHIGGIIINARDITERRRLEVQLADAQRKRQRAITSAVIRAQETERAQLGQELHDNVNQVLTTVKLYNEMLLDGLGDTREILGKSVAQLQNCINEIRSISKRLSAPTLGKISVEDSIRELVDSINLTNRLRIGFRIEGLQGKAIGQEIHLSIYRIIQEQLNNILKYAEAKNVTISLVNSPDQLELIIIDDGKGFDTGQKRTGIGITNMETRAEHINGKLEVASAPGEGCTVTARFPAVD